MLNVITVMVFFSGVSIVWMLIGYYYLNKTTEMENEDETRILKKKSKKLR